MIAISFLLAEGIYTHMYEDNVGAWREKTSFHVALHVLFYTIRKRNGNHVGLNFLKKLVQLKEKNNNNEAKHTFQKLSTAYLERKTVL